MVEKIKTFLLLVVLLLVTGVSLLLIMDIPSPNIPFSTILTYDDVSKAK